MDIAIIGYGKMGKIIEKIALEKGHRVVLRISRNNLHDLNKAMIGLADVAIEFSVPETAFSNVVFCLENNIPVVSGTTGWHDRLEEAKGLCKKVGGTFFHASNFSIGVNVLFALNETLARMMAALPQYRPAMEETHHIHKLDHPSGTAVTLADGIIGQMERINQWTGVLEGQEEQPTASADTLSIVSKRIGETPGTHTVSWESDIDRIEIGHVAYSREGFAVGALAAAEWVVGRKGCFAMKDMLGFNLAC